MMKMKLILYFVFCICCLSNTGASSASPSIQTDSLVTFTESDQKVVLKWKIFVPSNRSYTFNIYYRTTLLAAGNQDNFKLSKYSYKLFNDTEVMKSKLTFSIIFYRPDNFHEDMIKYRIYNNFLAILKVKDEKKYTTTTELWKQKADCEVCGKQHSFSYTILIGICAAVSFVTVLFTLWIIREKVAIAFGCKYGREKPKKVCFEIPPLASMIVVPRVQKILPIQNEITARIDINEHDNPFLKTTDDKSQDGTTKPDERQDGASNKEIKEN